MTNASTIRLTLTRGEAIKVLLALAVISEDMEEDHKTIMEIHDKIKRQIDSKEEKE